jgi:exopolysaccharide biosynthesis WecB/TagA/CpsF family protein
MNTVYVGGYVTTTMGRDDLSMAIARACRSPSKSERTPLLVFSSNGQGIALKGRNSSYDNAMKSADIIHADGMSVVIASRFTRNPIKERSATTDLFHDIAKRAIAEGLSLYFLGGSEDTNRRAVEAVLKQYPGLKVAGRRNGYFNNGDDDEICREIVSLGTDILFVGLGKPLQEIWSTNHKNKLTGVGCIKTCGGLYSFLSGEASRCPKWMQSAGMEWLYRLANDPKRLFWRYFTTNILAGIRLAMYTGHAPKNDGI